MDQLLQLTILITDEDELTGQEKTYRRRAVVPFESIGYICEGIDKKTIELVLMDGEILISDEKLDAVSEQWQAWQNDTRRYFFQSLNN